MKFTITMKDPDGPYDCIHDAAKSSLMNSGLSEAEQRALIDLRVEKMHEVTDRFFRHGEYLTIEIDTDAGTATVLPVKA